MSEDAGAHTCDMPLCAAHARQVGRNKHYCPRHHQQGMQPAGAPDQGSAQLGLFTGLLENVTESKC